MPRRSVWLVSAGFAVVTAAGVGVATLPADAAEGDIGIVSVSNVKYVQYKAQYGRTNTVTVSRSGNTVTVDDVLSIKAGTGCKAVRNDKTKVTCALKQAPVRTYIYVYDKNDTVTNKANIGMSADGGTGNDKLVGGAANDVLDGYSGADKLYGEGGNDTLQDATGDDVHYGGAGNDTMHGGDGNDKLYANAGNDKVYGGAGAEVLSAHEGDDLMYGQTSNDLFDGGTGNDMLSGETGDDKLYGGAGNDDLNGEQGRDHLNGGLDDDELSGDNLNWAAPASDTLLGAAGVDRVLYNLYTKPLKVDLDGVTGDDGQAGEKDTVGADVEGIVGGSGADVLTGNAAGNFIDGRGAVDVVRGGTGNDYLIGGDGKDSVYGEAGDDTLEGVDEFVDLLDAGTNGTVGDECLARREDDLVGCERPVY